MKEIVVISGKGGTGKTSLSAAFAVLGGADLVIADCDVDAADMHLLLEPDFAFSEGFFSGMVAHIDQDKCAACGECADVCRFDAIPVVYGRYVIDEIACEGCGYCSRVCSQEAITNHSEQVGFWYKSKLRTKATMVHARLKTGADNSGKLVAKVKREARDVAQDEQKDIILVDGSPGVGCPVVSSLSGASYVVLVTEPTVSGLHDLERVYELVRKFGIRAGCIINKADLNSDIEAKILGFLAREDIDLLGGIPYDESFTEAMTSHQTIVEHPGELARTVEQCWQEIINRVQEPMTSKTKNIEPKRSQI